MWTQSFICEFKLVTDFEILGIIDINILKLSASLKHLKKQVFEIIFEAIQYVIICKTGD